jgi:hypothetical protein
LPSALDAPLDGLVGRAFVGIHGEGPLGLVPGAGGDLEFVGHADLGDLENPFHVLNIAFYKRDEIVCGFDFSRFQRRGKGSGQSPADTGDHVVEGRRIFRPCDHTTVFFLVKGLDPTVHAEMNRFREVLNIGRAVRAFMLHDTDVTGMGYGHWRPPGIKDQ